MTIVETDRKFHPDDVPRLEDEALYELVDGNLVEKVMCQLANETVV